MGQLYWEDGNRNFDVFWEKKRICWDILSHPTEPKGICKYLKRTSWSAIKWTCQKFKFFSDWVLYFWSDVIWRKWKSSPRNLDIWSMYPCRNRLSPFYSCPIVHCFILMRLNWCDSCELSDPKSNMCNIFSSSCHPTTRMRITPLLFFLVCHTNQDSFSSIDISQICSTGFLQSFLQYFWRITSIFHEFFRDFCVTFGI